MTIVIKNMRYIGAIVLLLISKTVKTPPLDNAFFDKQQNKKISDVRINTEPTLT